MTAYSSSYSLGKNMRQWAVRWLLVTTLVALVTIPLVGIAKNTGGARRIDQSLVTAIRHFDDAAGRRRQDNTTHYVAAVTRLSKSTDDYAIVYIYDYSGVWCGSGGCRMLVFKHHDDSWALVSQTVATRPPICVLQQTDYGLHAISVRVEGGGIQPGYMAVLPFDGKKYSISPTQSPAFPMKPHTVCDVVLPSTEGASQLYSDNMGSKNSG